MLLLCRYHDTTGSVVSDSSWRREDCFRVQAGNLGLHVMPSCVRIAIPDDRLFGALRSDLSCVGDHIGMEEGRVRWRVRKQVESGTAGNAGGGEPIERHH